MSFISAATGEGVHELLGRVLGTLPALPLSSQGSLETGRVIQPLRPPPPREEVVREGPHTFVAHWPRAERIAARVGAGDWQGMIQLMQALRRMGLAQALEAQGIQFGDTVRIGSKELRWGASQGEP